MSVVILLADGARPDTLARATASGALPSLARLRAEGGLHAISTVFPSVTGPAYAPFITGRFPGPIGLPGLRWYDRARTRCTIPPYSRSYLGAEMRHLDGDLDPGAPTLFELAPSRLNAMSMLGRGARGGDHIGRGMTLMLRIAATHWRGDLRGWIAIDRAVGRLAARRLRERRPAFTFISLLGVDKASHAVGHESTQAVEALRVVDELAGSIRDDAERAGTWERTNLWIASDHGHSAVRSHDDIARAVAEAGHRVIAHPRVFRPRPEVAVMVSGNAMAHIYLELGRLSRPFWPEIEARWTGLVRALEARPSVDLLLLPHAPDRCEVRSPTRGRAMIEITDGRYSYLPIDGDPLCLGERIALTADESHDLTMRGDYPDALVQIAHLAGSARAGEIILSASRGWDFRADFEPIAHVSSHGALHREHMLVPLIANRPLARAPRRTADVMPSALAVLGLPIPAGLDGRSFV